MLANDAKDVVVVGAGSAGLSVSHFLKGAGVNHVVVERGEIGEPWRSLRWDSFRVNTPNFHNSLVGDPYEGPDPDIFPSHHDLVRDWESYAAREELPIRTRTRVTHVRQTADGGFEVDVESAEGARETIGARHVVVAAGGFTVAKVPATGAQLPASVEQFTATNYRNPGQLPAGAVLVVGSGDTGCQIAEEVVATGRKVYMCTSKRRRVPRRYRGHDSIHWGLLSGRYDWTLDKLVDKRGIWNPDAPLYSGVGPMGHTLSYQQIERNGVTLLGKLDDFQDGNLMFDGSLRANVAFGDESSAAFKAGTDALIADKGVDAPANEYDEADQPDTLAETREDIRSLNLAEAGITSVIWAIGFTHDFTWLDAPVFDDDGHPVQVRGETDVPGVYFVGLHWMYTLGSGLLSGVGRDAEYVANVIIDQVGATG
jgi:putative flavoprotein involved in K+ transport